MPRNEWQSTKLRIKDAQAKIRRSSERYADPDAEEARREAKARNENLRTLEREKKARKAEEHAENKLKDQAQANENRMAKAQRMLGEAARLTAQANAIIASITSG